MAGSNQICATGLGCKAEEVFSKWQYALDHPTEPVVVQIGNVQEVLMTDKDLTGMEKGLYRLNLKNISTASKKS